MPKFKYQAKKGPKELIEGEIYSESKEAVLDKVEKIGLTPVQIIEIEEESEVRIKGRIRPGDINNFWRHLSSLLKAKLPLLSGLDVCYQQAGKGKFKKVILDLYHQVKDGRQFSESLRKYPKVFKPLYISIVRAGEIASALDKAVDRLAQFGEREEEIKSRVQSAMAYPVFMLIVGVLTIITVMTFVIPKLIPMFMDMGQTLPLSTRILINSSNFLHNYWGPLLVFFVLFFIIIWKGSSSSYFNKFVSKLKTNLPFVRQIAKKNGIGRFARTFSLVLANGLPIFQALSISIPTLGDESGRDELEKVCEEIKAGSNLAKSLKRSKYFPNFVTSMIAVGEEGGDLVGVLDEVATIYERDVDKMIRIFSSLLEPILILGVGLIVGLIVMSIILPILQMNVLVQ